MRAHIQIYLRDGVIEARFKSYPITNNDRGDAAAFLRQSRVGNRTRGVDGAPTGPDAHPHAGPEHDRGTRLTRSDRVPAEQDMLIGAERSSQSERTTHGWLLRVPNASRILCNYKSAFPV